MGYSRLSSITIPAPTGTHTDFTFCLKGTLVDLKTVANGGDINNTVSRVGVTCPADFILSTSITGSPISSFGFAQYVATTGEYEIWVKIASYTASFTLYALFGDASVNTYQGGSQGDEFDSNTKLALHFPDGTTLSGKDFTSNAYDFTPSTGASAGTGKIDGGAALSASTNDFQSAATTLNATPMVMSFGVWVNVSSLASRQTIFSTTGSGTAQNWGIEVGPASSSNTFAVIVPGIFAAQAPSNSLTTGTWYHIAFTRNGTGNTYALYVNGASVAVTYNATDFIDSANAKQIGRRAVASQLLSGTIDELRYSTSVRSANWIATEYSNQNSPTTISASSAIGGLMLNSRLDGLGGSGTQTVRGL